MEIEKLNKFISKGIVIQNGDYLYQHDKEDDFLSNNIDFLKMYFIEESLGNDLKIHGLLSNYKKSVRINELDNFWWIFRLHPNERRALQIENK